VVGGFFFLSVYDGIGGGGGGGWTGLSEFRI